MSQYIIEAIQVGILETLEMTFFSALIAYLIRLPLGIILYATARGRLLENRIINLVLGVVVNILRSLPFLILSAFLIPLTRLVAGSSIGTIASIVPLTIGTISIVAHMVEASLCEVQPGTIEATTVMGAPPSYIILHFILSEATPSFLQGTVTNVATVLGYSAMAGVIGGGGLGTIALQHDYYRYQKDVLWSTVALLIIMVMIIQEVGSLITKKERKS